MFDSVKIAEEFCFNYDFRQDYVQHKVSKEKRIFPTERNNRNETLYPEFFYNSRRIRIFMWDQGQV